jgi:hypothetical protein
LTTFVRLTGRATSLSWIPSESVAGWLRSGFDLRLAHYDDPPQDSIGGADEVARLRDDDRLRFANVVSGWADFEGPAPVGGFDADAGLVMGSTTVRLGAGTATFMGYALPVLRPDPDVQVDRVVLTQTVGGRTGVPLPRPVRHPPYVRWQAPIVWTTVSLTLHRDGRVEADLVGASAFPRHWVYGTDGKLSHKSGVTRMQDWMDHSFGMRTPWGEQDSPALVVAAESALERALSGQIMEGASRPDVQRLAAGAVLTRQGEAGTEVFLVLDGVLDVDVAGDLVAEVGPGAVIGERAVLEGGTRTATVTARTDARVVRVPGAALDQVRLQELSQLHRREND